VELDLVIVDAKSGAVPVDRAKRLADNRAVRALISQRDGAACQDNVQRSRKNREKTNRAHSTTSSDDAKHVNTSLVVVLARQPPIIDCENFVTDFPKCDLLSRLFFSVFSAASASPFSTKNAPFRELLSAARSARIRPREGSHPLDRPRTRPENSLHSHFLGSAPQGSPEPSA
jgi:hypothetical protein